PCAAPEDSPCLSHFFFRAEDGIRDLIVTGVQTCALPIYLAIEQGFEMDVVLYRVRLLRGGLLRHRRLEFGHPRHTFLHIRPVTRSEERRVGKECRSRRTTSGPRQRRTIARVSSTSPPSCP